MSDEELVARAEAARHALFDARRFAEGVAPAAEVCRLRPDSGSAWWNYAVALKHALRWEDCLAASDRAIAIAPDDADGMHWNAGISATALGNWSRARDAWAACDIAIPAGEGPLELTLGMSPVRVSVDADPEVVWCERIDPCRARIRSIPLPESRRRFGDLLLHDGEPRGTRDLDGRARSVFDELTRLDESPYGTWEVIARCDTEAERDGLLARFDDLDGAVEDWSETLERLCSACSLGEPHEHERAAPAVGWAPTRRLAIAARGEHELRRLRRLKLWWRREVRSVERVL